jgi:magnesium-transporting ATPase (P-type)
MIQNNKPNRFSLVNFIGTIWSVHILIAALLFPRSLLPTDEQIQRQNVYKLTSLIFGTLILLVNILSLVVMFTRPTWVEAAKVFFIFLTWLTVGVIYILFNYLHDIYQLFALLEEEAIQGRDQSVMLIRAGQAALKAGNRKLLAQTDTEFSFNSLLKKVGPLALLFLQKKKNLVHIALEAGKVLFMGSRLFKNLF